MELNKGKCPDCPKERQGNHQILYDCPDGTARCMACRAKVIRKPAATTEVTTEATPPAETGPSGNVPGPPTTAEKRDSRFTKDELGDACTRFKTMKEVCNELWTTPKTVRRYAKAWGIDWPGKGSHPGRPRKGQKKNVRKSLTVVQFMLAAKESKSLAELAKKAGVTESGARQRCDRLGMKWPGYGSAPKPGTKSVPVANEFGTVPHLIHRSVEVSATFKDQEIIVRNARHSDCIEVVIDGVIQLEALGGTWREVARMVLAQEKAEKGD